MAPLGMNSANSVPAGMPDSVLSVLAAFSTWTFPLLVAAKMVGGSDILLLL
ncbi:hypothetical protein D3C71_1740470 [compost metagenome]